MVDDETIHVLTHGKGDFRRSFPVDGFPESFPQHGISFVERTIDVTNAEQALDYQGVFGLENLSESEMVRAIEISKREELVSFDEFRRDVDDDWSDDSILCAVGHKPFHQAVPSRICSNPDCTVPLNVELTEVFKRPIRQDSRTLIALYEPDIKDGVGLDWQILFQFCDSCKLVTVTNQCD